MEMPLVMLLLQLLLKLLRKLRKLGTFKLLLMGNHAPSTYASSLHDPGTGASGSAYSTTDAPSIEGMLVMPLQLF